MEELETEPVTSLQPSGETRAACSCGAGPNPQHASRCASGHVIAGNALATKIGETSAAFWNAHAEARQEIALAVVRDAGFSTQDAPRALVLAADSIAQATLIRDAAYARMVEAGGPLSADGRVRRAFLAWTAAVDRLERHLRLVGLERRGKPINPLEAVRRAVEDANR
jgi:hypothetical protein